MKKAIDQANIKPSEIDYVNAMQLLLQWGIPMKLRPYFAVFGKEMVPVVSSTKSWQPRILDAGASEIVYLC